MYGTHAASMGRPQSLGALEAQRYGDELEPTGGLLGSTRIRQTDTDEGCCSRLCRRVTEWSANHPRVCHGAGMLGGLLFIAAGAITLAHDPHAKLAAALWFVAGGAGVIGPALHCYMDTRQDML